MSIYVCPKCSGKIFHVTAHVTQDWLVNEYGDYLETVEACSQVVHFPDNDDVWLCVTCGYEDAGSEFKEETNG